MKNDAEETVEVSTIDPLLKQQQSYIEQMRTNMLTCGENGNLARTSLNNIAALRIYHQMSKIIRYLDLMDKLEEKLYSSIEYQIDNMSEENTSTWMTLLSIQEKLQKNMIESMKLLQPYMDMADFVELEVPDTSENVPTLAYDAATRDELRVASTTILNEIKAG